MAATIRPRQDEDIPALASILVRVYESDGYPVEGVADPERWLSPSSELESWVAVNEHGDPIGQITLVQADPDDDAARIWHRYSGGDVQQLAIPMRLFVEPGHRHIGAGRQLMEKAVRHAHGLGLSVSFDVMVKDQAAIRLYERLGAHCIGDVEHRYGNGLVEPAAVYVIPTGQDW